MMQALDCALIWRSDGTKPVHPPRPLGIGPNAAGRRALCGYARLCPSRASRRDARTIFVSLPGDTMIRSLRSCLPLAVLALLVAASPLAANRPTRAIAAITPSARLITASSRLSSYQARRPASDPCAIVRRWWLRSPRTRASSSSSFSLTRPVLRNSFRCRLIAGRDMPNCSASSLARCGSRRSRSMTPRLVGSASASKV